MSTRRSSRFPLHHQSPNSCSPFRVLTDDNAKPTTDKIIQYYLFEPDILIPSQYFATTLKKGYVEPEKKLALAILKDAVACFQKYAATSHPEGRALFDEVEEWVLDKDNLWPFSFENICEILEFNTVYLRKGLRHWKEKELAKRSKAKVYRLVPKTKTKNQVGRPKEIGQLTGRKKQRHKTTLVYG